MPSYRLVFRDKQTPAREVSFVGVDAAAAFRLAQGQHCPADLWAEGKHVCTLSRSGKSGEIWVISGVGGRRPAAAAQDAGRPKRSA